MMYVPEHFNQESRDEIDAFLQAHPFANVIVNLDGELWPTPLPLMYQPSANGEGKFIGHVAFANDMWRADATQDVLVIVHGPDAYITPNWYATKAETHEVVPTWNYSAVYAWGSMTVHHDAKFKRMAVGLLTKIHESASEVPWKMGDAPQDYLASQLDHIVGFEIEITRIVAKNKLSQNRIDADRAGVVDGLSRRGTVADHMIRDLMTARNDDA